MNKTIYDLKLHEVLFVKTEIGVNWRVTRVHRGWFYQDNNPNLTTDISFFVPHDDELVKEV